MIDTILQDLRYALRTLRRSPGFTTVAILTLALGIGANTAVFTVVNAVLLRPLPYREPERLVMVWESNSSRHRDKNIVNPENYLDWRERATAFSGLSAVTWTSITLTGGTPELVSGRAVTPDFFSVMGAAPALGRTFTAAEALPNGPSVIVLSNGLWKRRFGGDPQIVGTTVPVAGGSAMVLGVMPATFLPLAIYGDEEYWTPFRLDLANRTHSGRYAMVIGRLRSGASLTQARSEMETIAGQLQREYPDYDAGWSTNVVSLTDQVVGPTRLILLVLLGAVTLVLLIACANVANLTLARVAARGREMAVRTALGAPRWRLIRQWLAESVLLGLAGGAAGVVLAGWGVSLLLAAGPSDVPRLSEVRLDGRVLGVTALVSVGVGVVFGLIAAWGRIGRGEHTGIRGEEKGLRTTAGASAGRFRGALIVAQVSLSLVLLAGAGLLLRSLQRLSAVDPGFDPRNLLTAAIDLPGATYPDLRRQSAFFDRLLDRVKTLPGVSGAGTITFLPVSGPNAATSFVIIGRPAPAPGQSPVADIRVADSGYFAAMRIPLLRGRPLSGVDGPSGPPVVVINETLARLYWPQENPIGHRLQISWTNPTAQPEIVGIVGNVHAGSLDADIRPMIYYSTFQEPAGSRALVVRYADHAGGLGAAVRTAIHELDGELPVANLASMYSHMAESMSNRRYPMLLLIVFAVLAVTLSAIGLYGVMAYTVGQRTREIGVRVALGAQAQDVLRLVGGQGMRLVGIGILVGVGGALAATRVLRTLLYEVAPYDPTTLLGVSVLLVGVALIAIAVPLRRAMRVDPMVALRTE